MDNNIIKYFIEDPNTEFHIRELAKLSKKSPTTISKYLNDLKKRGILRSRRERNHLLFRSNTDNPAFRDEKLFYNIKKIREAGLVEYLNEEFNHPEAIVLFGSFRKAENTPLSDIDILIITSSKNRPNIEKFEKKLGHKIQIFLHSRKDVNRMKIKNRELLNNFLNGIVLDGFWEVFR